MKAFLDFIPLLVFFYLFKTEDVFVTQGLLLSTTAVYALHFGLQKANWKRRSGSPCSLPSALVR